MKHSARAAARQARDQAGRNRENRRRPLSQLPYWIVLTGIIAGLATMRGGGQAVRGGTLVIAGALLAGSVLRIVLPEGRAGMLGSRRRLADVAVLTVLGVGLLIAGLIVQIPG